MKNLIVLGCVFFYASFAKASPAAFSISFVNGASASINTCKNASVFSLNSMLAVNDNAVGKTLTWSVVTGPSHGTLTGFPATGITTGAAVLPLSTGYQSTNGYSGNDNFVIQVSDGLSTTQIAITVQVGAPPALPVFIQSQTVVNQGQIGVVYAVASDAQGTSYNWIYIGSGVTINSNNTNSMTMDFGSNSTSGTLFVQITGPCGNSAYQALNIVVITTPLPVKLTAFTATASQDHALLQWTTASEENSDHFKVQKSTDGHQFFTVGQVSAAQTSSTKRNYQFTDSSSNNQLTYYRLLQVDVDGKSYSSPVRILDFHARPPVLSVYPNPLAGNTLSVRFDAVKRGAYELRLTTLTGQILMQKAGTYPVSGTASITLPELVRGLYIIEIKDGSGTVAKRLIKE